MGYSLSTPPPGDPWRRTHRASPARPTHSYFQGTGTPRVTSRYALMALTLTLGIFLRRLAGGANLHTLDPGISSPGSPLRYPQPIFKCPSPLPHSKAWPAARTRPPYGHATKAPRLPRWAGTAWTGSGAPSITVAPLVPAPLPLARYPLLLRPAHPFDQVTVGRPPVWPWGEGAPLETRTVTSLAHGPCNG